MSAQALVLEGERRLVRASFDLPTVQADDAILRVEACGLCGTDHEQYTGSLQPGFSFIPGHEVVGVIESIGATAAERWGVAQGDRVAVEVFQSCRHCAECRSGSYIRCEQHGTDDMYGYVSVDSKPALWGGYATHMYLSPDALVLPVPDGVDPVDATLFNPLGAGIRWGVTIPGTKTGDVVAILGPGIRGLAALAAVKAAGARFVVITGYGERDRTRLELARELGADLTVDVAAESAPELLLEAAGQLADVVVHVAGNAPAALGQATALAREGGTISMAGMQGAAGSPGFHPDDIPRKALRILGSWGVDTASYRQALELLAEGTPLSRVPRLTSDLNGVAGLIEAMAGETSAPGAVHGVVVP